MAAELKLIFEGLGNIKKQIEDAFKSGVNISGEQKSSSKFGKSIEKINKTIKTLESKLQKNLNQQSVLEYQKNILEKSTKGLKQKLTLNNSTIKKLTDNVKKLQGSIVSGVSEKRTELVENITKNQEALKAMENKLSGLESKKAKIESKPEFINAKTEKLLDKINIQIAKTSNNILSMNNNIAKKIFDLEQNDDVIKINQSIEKKITSLNDKINLYSNKNIEIENKLKSYADKNQLYSNKIEMIMKNSKQLQEEQLSAFVKLLKIDEQIQNSFSKFDKILLGIYNKFGMTKSADKLIDKRIGVDGKKSAKSGIGFGGAAIMGGVAGMMMQLVKSTKAIQFVLDMIGGLLNALIGPLLPILLTLLKPFLLLFVRIGQFMYEYFKDPFKALLSFGTFLVNSFIAGLENGINWIIKAINLIIQGINMLIPGTSMDIPTLDLIEIPRLQWDIIEVAYDNYKSGISNITDFFKGVGNAFIKNSDYVSIMENGINNGITKAELLKSIVENGTNNLTETYSNALQTMINAGEILNNKYKDFYESLGYTTESDTLMQSLISPINEDKIKNNPFTNGSLFDTISENTKNFATNLNNNLIDSGNKINKANNSFYDKLTSSFSTIYDSIVNSSTDIYTNIIDSFDSLYTKLKPSLDTIYTDIVNAFNSLIRKINNTKISGNRGNYSVNDAIISPSGKIITTHPQDYLIATKNPQSLSNGNNITIKLTVNGGTDNNTINTIIKKLRSELNRQGV